MREILDAAWDAAHETSIAGLTLRDIATRVGMQQPSLYSHFASKQAIYDAMFKQAWQIYLDAARSADNGSRTPFNELLGFAPAAAEAAKSTELSCPSDMTSL